jgi:surfeit locus 1 family protein
MTDSSKSGEAKPRRFPVGLTIAAAIAFAILIGLGVWQVRRLAWKNELLAEIARAERAPARPVAEVLREAAAGQDVEFVRVIAECSGLDRASWLELYALREGQAGVRLISACPLRGAPHRTLLVDRGFVADTISARPPREPGATNPVRVVGVLRSAESRSMMQPENWGGQGLWYARDARAMAAALLSPDPAPVFLFAETSTNPEWKALTPAPLPREIRNPHLGYAITWFGLAAALAGVYLAVVFRRR